MDLSHGAMSSLLKKYRIPVVKEISVKTKSEAIKAAESIGYPVALKILSSEISHKTEVGGVEINLKYKHEVEDAFDRICKNVKKARKKMQGVLAQQMGKGYEVIIGGKTDEQFGPVLMFGLGGIWVEALQDVSFRVCPLSRKDALEMVQEIKGYKILHGFRGKPKADIGRLVEIILKCSNMMVKERLKEFDINPLFVSDKDILAVDFRMKK